MSLVQACAETLSQIHDQLSKLSAEFEKTKQQRKAVLVTEQNLFDEHADVSKEHLNALNMWQAQTQYITFVKSADEALSSVDKRLKELTGAEVDRSLAQQLKDLSNDLNKADESIRSVETIERESALPTTSPQGAASLRTRLDKLRVAIGVEETRRAEQLSKLFEFEPLATKVEQTHSAVQSDLDGVEGVLASDDFTNEQVQQSQCTLNSCTSRLTDTQPDIQRCAQLANECDAKVLKERADNLHKSNDHLLAHVDTLRNRAAHAQLTLEELARKEEIKQQLAAAADRQKNLQQVCFALLVVLEKKISSDSNDRYDHNNNDHNHNDAQRAEQKLAAEIGRDRQGAR